MQAETERSFWSNWILLGRLQTSEIFRSRFFIFASQKMTVASIELPAQKPGKIFLIIYHPLAFPSEKAIAPHSSTPAWKIPWTEEPGGLQSMGSYESDTTERLHFHFSLSCFGEGNGNPLQCSCLENPRDGGAWWAAISGVAQSRTRLKRLSSSSSSSSFSLSCWSPSPVNSSKYFSGPQLEQNQK